MSEIKWYKRDPNAALTGMMCLSLEERGAYNTVLDLIYTQGGSVLDDDRYLAGWMRCDVRVWKRIKTKLIDTGKLYSAGGSLRNKAADKAVDEARSRIASAKEAGVTSAAKRAAQLSKNNCLTSTGVQRELQLSTSTPTVIQQKVRKIPSAAGPMPFDELPTDWRAWVVEERGWDDDVTADVWSQFRDYWTVGKGRTTKRPNWEPTWRNWCRKENIQPKGTSYGHTRRAIGQISGASRGSPRTATYDDRDPAARARDEGEAIIARRQAQRAQRESERVGELAFAGQPPSPG